VLIADANIWIDLFRGDLLAPTIRSCPGLVTTDLVIHELKDAELGVHLVSAGIDVRSLSGAQVTRVRELRATDFRPSVADYSALVLAEDPGAVLLTGDAALRSIAVAETIEVHGTLWLVESLVVADVLSADMAADGLEVMLAVGRRLPVRETTERIERFRRMSLTP